MTKSSIHRIVPMALFGIVLGSASLALAAPSESDGPAKESPREHGDHRKHEGPRKHGGRHHHEDRRHHEGGRKECSGEHRGKGPEERFQRADKNGDGYISKEEAGEHWDRIKIADADNDGKVSKAELKKAHDEGKFPRHPGGPHGDHGRGGEKPKGA